MSQKPAWDAAATPQCAYEKSGKKSASDRGRNKKRTMLFITERQLSKDFQLFFVMQKGQV